MGDEIEKEGKFDPKKDAETLMKAMQGLGTDNKAIMDLLTSRNHSERVHIAMNYKRMYGKDLIDDLKYELTGNFEDLIVGLVMPQHEYLASELNRAMVGAGTDEDALIEILCTAENDEIFYISDAYKKMYGNKLEDDIKSDTSGHFRRLLVSLCSGGRSNENADEQKAKKHAQDLYDAGVAKWGTDESVFNAILCTESVPQLKAIFKKYEELAGHSVVTAIESEMSGDLKNGMIAIARTVENKALYFAEKLYNSMKGLGTDDKTLIRIIISREADLEKIKDEYAKKYGIPLADSIRDDTSGCYLDALITLVNKSP